MADKFLNKYRIPSARWRSWNYAGEGAYFITICIKNRTHIFGNVVNGEMQLSEIGKIAEQEWLKSPSLRPDMNLNMEIRSIMPNHIHGIILIGRNEFNSGNNDNNTACRDAIHGVSDDLFFSDTKHGDVKHEDAKHGVCTEMIEINPPANHFGPQSKNLASVLRGFKSAVTMQARLIDAEFGWQERFHDHVIRDDDEFRRIAYYIEENPINWEADLYYKPE